MANLIASGSGANRTITVNGAAMPTSSGGAPLLELRSLRGEEALSTIYNYTLELVTPAEPAVSSDEAANIDLKKMIGKELTVTIALDGMGVFVPGQAGGSGRSRIGAGKREITGVVFQARYLGQEDRRGRYEVIIRPWVALAAGHTDYRIFQNKTVNEIIDSVLGAYPGILELHLAEVYPRLEFQVQYGETDFNFAQRLMQEYGMYWFFRHEDGKHKMIVVDNPGAHQPPKSQAYQTLPYCTPDQRIDQEYIDEFDVTQTWQPGVWTTNDYDFTQPMTDLTTRQQLPQQTALNAIERYEWPGDYADKGTGGTLATVRMQELRAKGERAFGHGNLRDVECGTRFTLTNFPQKEANRSYLVISAAITAQEKVDVSGESAYSFDTTFEVQPDTEMFRPERTVPKPRTTGPQTAVVTGAPGEQIWTDQYGRVKVKFRWDRLGPNDQNSSCWIRVSCPWAGGNFGSVSIPRVGTEVIVDFENGDPDRPIITGAVYNAANMPPWDLPDGATQSGMLSRTPQGQYGNSNAIRFEDKPGSEELWLQAERNMRTEVESDESHSVGGNRSKTVSGNETAAVTGNRNKTVGGDETTGITGNRTETVTKNEVVTITGTRDENVTGAKTSTLQDSHTVTVADHQTITVGNGQDITVQSSDMTITVAGGSLSASASTLISLACGASSLTMDSGGNVTINGSTFKTNMTMSSITDAPTVMTTATAITNNASGGSITSSAQTIVTNASGDITNTAAKSITSSASGKHTVEGTLLLLNP